MYDNNIKLRIFLCCRAAQKLNLSSSPHRRRRSGDENIGPDELPIFPNGYAALLLKSPPPAPPALLRRIGVKELTGVGKVSPYRYRSLRRRRRSFSRYFEKYPTMNLFSRSLPSQQRQNPYRHFSSRYLTLYMYIFVYIYFLCI